MKKPTKFGLFVIAMSLSAASAGNPEPGLCQRLAKPAEQVPVADWTASFDDPMDRLVNGHALGGSAHALSPVEERLVNDPALRQQLSVGPEAVLGVDQLAGTDIYRIDAFQGTANCQYMVFVEASTGTPPRRVPAPFDASPCTTQYGRFGQAFGQPLFMVGGQVTMSELARSYTIAAWQGQGKGWTRPCELKLEFEERLALSGSYCLSDTALCRAAADMAPTVVAAYRQRPRLDPLAFAGGRQPPEALALQFSKPSIALEFPTFGGSTAGARNPFLTNFSNARPPALLGLWIDGRWWLGVVGIAGIGWRESTTSLVVIYTMTDAGPVPAASFQVEQLPAGSARAHWK